MDDLVKAALLKWPNVPACFGWLGLDARGQWWMRDDKAQSCGTFASGAPGARGSLLKHEKLIEFIGRNYATQEDGPFQGAWFFQNGPQKVFVELEAAAFAMRVGDYTQMFPVETHTGISAQVRRCICDERGHVYLLTDQGNGLVHSQDMAHAASAIEQGHWVLEHVRQADLTDILGVVLSPAAIQQAQAPGQ
jgi:hypothetical protein